MYRVMVVDDSMIIRNKITRLPKDSVKLKMVNKPLRCVNVLSLMLLH